MNTFTKTIASLAILSALAAPAAARSDSDEGHLSAYAQVGQSAQSANILVNRAGQ
jgi:hypothetical protein